MGIFGRKDEPGPPRPDPATFDATTQEYDGFEVSFAEFLCGARVNMSSGRIDVVVHHPLFALLSPESRTQAASDALVAALGEGDASTWVGAVTVSVDTPIDSLAIPLLGHVIDQMRPMRRRFR